MGRTPAAIAFAAGGGAGVVRRLVIAAALAAMLACGGPETARLEIGGEIFQLEVARDPVTRHRGLGGRTFISPNGGMLFVYGRAEPRAVVMRDCPIAIDVAFLDAGGRVLSVRAMDPEPPRRPDETPSAYESRLRVYPSRGPAQFIIETAGGRLSEVGLEAGQEISLDVEGLVRRLR
jgi:uncharacterized membrane protein (UPF0127 family)